MRVGSGWNLANVTEMSSCFELLLTVRAPPLFVLFSDGTGHAGQCALRHAPPRHVIATPFRGEPLQLGPSKGPVPPRHDVLSQRDRLCRRAPSPSLCSGPGPSLHVQYISIGAVAPHGNGGVGVRVDSVGRGGTQGRDWPQDIHPH